MLRLLLLPPLFLESFLARSMSLLMYRFSRLSVITGSITHLGHYQADLVG